jgi:tetratricopeptide (TPR) repeat protein
LSYKSIREIKFPMPVTRIVLQSSALLASFIFLSCLPAQVARDAGGDRISLISDALQNKESEKALELLHPALLASPRNPQLWSMQGTAYAQENHTKEALDSFHHALKISPDYLPALHGAAQIEYDAGRPEAIPLIEHVTRLQPSDLISHGMLAVLNFQQAKCADAADQFEKAGSLFDSQPTALHAYAVCLVRLKRFEQAAMVFEKTVALKPDDKEERRLLAAIQVMAHQPDEALNTLGPLMHEAAPDAATLELASTAYEAAKDTSQAVDSLRQAILLDPRNVNLYLDFANISYTHGSFQVGIDVINDGMGQLPNAAPLYFARGVLYVQLAQYDKAEADFEKAYDLDPNQSLSAAAQGLAAAQENDFDRALSKVQASLTRRPDDPLLLYLQADIIAEKHVDPGTPEFQLAVRSARRAIALQPTEGAAAGVLGKLYLQSGKYQEAAIECRKALANDPKDQSAVYHLIQALRRTGQSSEIPDLLKQLALLRRQAEQDERERYRYKLVDPDSPR